MSGAQELGDVASGAGRQPQRLAGELNFATDKGEIRARRIWQKGPITIWENLKPGASAQRYLLLILQLISRKRGAETELLERPPRMRGPDRERNTKWFYTQGERDLVHAVCEELYHQFMRRPWNRKIVPYERIEGFAEGWPRIDEPEPGAPKGGQQ